MDGKEKVDNEEMEMIIKKYKKVYCEECHYWDIDRNPCSNVKCCQHPECFIDKNISSVVHRNIEIRDRVASHLHFNLNNHCDKFRLKTSYILFKIFTIFLFIAMIIFMIIVPIIM